MEKIFIKGAMPPAGHYTPAIISSNILYVSGQLPINPFTGEKCLGSLEDQTQRVLENLSLIIKSADTNINKVIKVTVYLSDINDWDKVNKVYSDFFDDHKPVRVVVPTNQLHYGFKIEIDAVVEL